MTTPNLSTTDLRTSEEARDLQTLLFIDLHTSLGAEPEGIPEAERLNESDHHDIHLDLHAEESKHSPFEGIGITLTEPSLVARSVAFAVTWSVRLPATCALWSRRAAIWSTWRLCFCLSRMAILRPAPSKAAVGIGFIHGFIHEGFIQLG